MDEGLDAESEFKTTMFYSGILIKNVKRREISFSAGDQDVSFTWLSRDIKG